MWSLDGLLFVLHSWNLIGWFRIHSEIMSFLAYSARRALRIFYTFVSDWFRIYNFACNKFVLYGYNLFIILIFDNESLRPTCFRGSRRSLYCWIKHQIIICFQKLPEKIPRYCSSSHVAWVNSGPMSYKQFLVPVINIVVTVAPNENNQLDF